MGDATLTAISIVSNSPRAVRTTTVVPLSRYNCLLRPDSCSTVNNLYRIWSMVCQITRETLNMKVLYQCFERCCFIAAVSRLDHVMLAADDQSRTGLAPTLDYDVISSYYCSFCHKYFKKQDDLEEHCADAEHKLNVNSDKERQWNHRPPPWDVADGNYKMCSKY